MTVTDEISTAGMTRVGARPPLGAYLRETWERRDFIVSMARFKIEAENQENRLGILWVVLKPLLNAAVIGLIFGILMGPSHRPPQFISFLVIGVFFFEFFQTSMTTGAKAVTSNVALVQSLSFPRISLPISVVVQRFMQLLPALGIMAVIIMAFGNWPSFQWLLVIPLLIAYFCFNLGFALIMARLTVQVRDLANLIPYLVRLVFYSTGVFFSFDLRFASHPFVLHFVDYQPVYVFLTQARAIFLHGKLYEIRPDFWVTMTVWSLAVLLIGIVYFWAAEERYGRVD